MPRRVCRSHKKRTGSSSCSTAASRKPYRSGSTRPELMYRGTTVSWYYLIRKGARLRMAPREKVGSTKVIFVRAFSRPDPSYGFDGELENSVYALPSRRSGLIRTVSRVTSKSSTLRSTQSSTLEPSSPNSRTQWHGWKTKRQLCSRTAQPRTRRKAHHGS